MLMYIQVFGGVTAGAGDITGVPDFIARFEIFDRAADGFDDTARIPAEDFRRIQTLFLYAFMHFGIDRVD